MSKLTVKQIAQKYNVSAHTIRFYDDEGLFPDVMRDAHGARIFTEANLEWIYLVLCLRSTGMSVADIKNFIRLCGLGDATMLERYRIILAQKEKAEREMEELEQKVAVLNKKEKYYEDALKNKGVDVCNPLAKQEMVVN